MLNSLIPFLKFAKDKTKDFKDIRVETLSTHDKGKLTINYAELRTRYRLHPKTQQRIIKDLGNIFYCRSRGQNKGIIF